MTRATYTTASERREHALRLLRPEGITLQQVATAMGYANVSNASIILASLEFAGQAFKVRAKLKQDTRKQSSEIVYFPTQADLDAFVTAHREAKRLQDLARKKSAGYRTAYYAKRNEQRRIARQESILQKQAERAQREALKLAEAEQRKQRARLDREAKAAQQAREKAEAKKTQQRLKTETKAAGKLAIFKTTAKPAPVRIAITPRHDLPIIIPEGLQIQRAPTPPDRWAVTNPAPIVNASECRTWAKAVTA